MRWPSIVLASAMVLLYGLGVYGLVSFLALHPDASFFGRLLLGAVGEMVSGSSQTVTYVLIVLAVVTVICIPLILKAMAKFGRKAMMLTIFGPSIFIVALGLLLVSASFFSAEAAPALLIAGGVLIAIGMVLFLIFYELRAHVYLAGSIFELSAMAVATEMGTLVPSILFGIFSVLNVIMGAAAGAFVFGQLAQANAWVQGVVVFLLELGYAWLLFSFMYLADGTIIGIIDDWYRNPTVDKANLGKGFARVRRVIGPVIQFAFVMALLSTVARAARRRAGKARGGGGIGAMIVLAVSALAYGLVQFVTYFALPAMVIDGTGFKDGVKRSYTLVWRHGVDVLLAYIGIDGTYALFMVAMLALYGISGATAGWLLIAPAMATTVSPIFVSVFSAIAFVLVGFIPAYLLFRPMKVAYNTILYEYAKDMETANPSPSRMTPNIREQFESIIGQAQTRPGIARWAEPEFH